MTSHCAKRHRSLWHIRKTKSSRVLYHGGAAVCRILPRGGWSFRTNAIGFDRRWASERHWREWIKECGRWQWGVTLSIWQSGRRVFFSPGWAAQQLKRRWKRDDPPFFFAWVLTSFAGFQQSSHTRWLACRWGQRNYLEVCEPGINKRASNSPHAEMTTNTPFLFYGCRQSC